MFERVDSPTDELLGPLEIIGCVTTFDDEVETGRVNVCVCAKGLLLTRGARGLVGGRLKLGNRKPLNGFEIGLNLN